MMRTTPFRRTTLHFSQIFLTLGRTFMTPSLTSCLWSQHSHRATAKCSSRRGPASTRHGRTARTSSRISPDRNRAVKEHDRQDSTATIRPRRKFDADISTATRSPRRTTIAVARTPDRDATIRSPLSSRTATRLVGSSSSTVPRTTDAKWSANVVSRQRALSKGRGPCSDEFRRLLKAGRAVAHWDMWARVESSWAHLGSTTSRRERTESAR